MEQYARKTQTAEPLVYYTVVFSVVTQNSSWEKTLRDDTKNGCVADYGAADKREISLRGRRKMKNGEEKKCKSEKEEVSFALSRTPLPLPFLQEPTQAGYTRTRAPALGVSIRPRSSPLLRDQWRESEVTARVDCGQQHSLTRGQLSRTD